MNFFFFILRRNFRRNLDSFRRNLDEMSYSMKCLLEKLRLGEMSVDEMSFRRNAFRGNGMDPKMRCLPNYSLCPN